MNINNDGFWLSQIERESNNDLIRGAIDSTAYQRQLFIDGVKAVLKPKPRNWLKELVGKILMDRLDFSLEDGRVYYGDNYEGFFDHEIVFNEPANELLWLSDILPKQREIFWRFIIERADDANIHIRR